MSERSERPEIVHWRDAYFDAEQIDQRDWKEDYIVRTVGWVVGEDTLFVHLALECLPEGEYRGVTHIPRAMILERHPLVNGARGSRGTREGQGRAPVEEARQEDAR